MIAQDRTDPLLRVVLLAAGVVVIAAGLRAAAPLVNAVLLATLLALTLLPAKQALMRRGLSRPLAVAALLLGVLLGGGLLVAAVAAAVGDFVDRAPEYEAQLAASLGQLEAEVAARGLDLGSFTPGAAEAMGLLEGLVSGVLAALGWALLGLVLIALLMLELPLPSVEPMSDPRMRDRLSAIYSAVQRYMMINGAVAGGAALASLLAMWAFGAEHAVLWAVLMFLLAFVPFGVMLAALPPVGLTALEHGAGGALALGAVLVVVNVLADNVIKPRYLGEGFGLPLSVVVLAFLGWGFVLGPFGALLAMPLTIALIEAAPLLHPSHAPGASPDA